MEVDGEGSADREEPPAHGTRPPPLIGSGVIAALADFEGVDLETLRLPNNCRRVAGARADEAVSCLLEWSAIPSMGFCGPKAALSFFETYELSPGLVVRGFNHPKGRLGFSLDGADVLFELHVPSAGVLIRGTPARVTFALPAPLPATVTTDLVGRPLERLLDWPPTSGSDHLIGSVETEGSSQTVSLTTTPIPIVQRGSGGRQATS